MKTVLLLLLFYYFINYFIIIIFFILGLREKGLCQGAEYWSVVFSDVKTAQSHA